MHANMRICSAGSQSKVEGDTPIPGEGHSFIVEMRQLFAVFAQLKVQSMLWDAEVAGSSNILRCFQLPTVELKITDA